ncbi:MAG: inosine-5-monophosphate dehydrogenase [Thermoprotei archaeon]|nr:MAG: inosine-5-monophosphate dehydrogenase [Thermoprotei archaeon]
MFYPVSHIMSTPVISTSIQDTLAHVRKLMLRHHITRIVVVSPEEKPVGIITQKDMVRVLANTLKDIDNILAGEVMSTPLITVRPETPIPLAAKIMLEKDISSIIVVDERNFAKGIVTKTDMCRHYAERFRGVATVRDFMTKDVVTVRSSTSIYRVIEVMSENNLDRVVVVEGKEPVGIITSRDLIFGVSFKERRKTGRCVGRGSRIREIGLKAYRRASIALMAEDVMNYPLITIKEDADLADAAETMLREDISGLPVVDDTGSLKGIITKSDITRAIAFIGGETIT